MGRRAEHQRDELIDMTMAAAREILREKGMRAVSVRGIMAKIGYSAGTFYNLFSNFDDLCLQLAGEVLRKMLQGSREIERTDDVVRTLKNLTGFYMRFTRENALEWQLVVEHRLPEGQSHPRWYRLLVMEVLREVEKATRPLFAEADNERRRRAALTLWASVQGICSVTQPGSLTAASEERAQELSDQLVDFFVAGLRVQNS
jgi:AcrR family transcriptional regulator